MTSHQHSFKWSPLQKTVLLIGLLAWFGIAYVIGVTQVVATQSLTPYRPIALTALVPVGLFLVAYAVSDKFKSFVLAQDLRLLTALQLWRVIGFAFLALYAFGALPGLFAWPAGVGDVAVGVIAFAVVVRMTRDSNFAETKKYIGFHLFGLMDFVVAIVTASLSSGVFPVFVQGGLTSGAMEVWPLNLFPSFLVPIFIILHLVALLQVRQMRRGGHDGVETNATFALAG